jgi:hypothetical protein
VKGGFGAGSLAATDTNSRDFRGDSSMHCVAYKMPWVEL